jgi:hypothetical protein
MPSALYATSFSHVAAGTRAQPLYETEANSIKKITLKI